jgi:hypothetical protein
MRLIEWEVAGDGYEEQIIIPEESSPLYIPKNDMLCRKAKISYCRKSVKRL